MVTPPVVPSRIKAWSGRENDLLSLLVPGILILALGGFTVFGELQERGSVSRAILGGLCALVGLALLALLWLRARSHEHRRGHAHETLLWLGIAGMLGLILANELLIPASTAPRRGSLWPLFLAAAGCVYLWWLASLIFDLVFVWHRYIQGDVAMNFLRKDMHESDTDRGPDSTPTGHNAPRPPPAPQPNSFPLKFRKQSKPQITTTD